MLITFQLNSNISDFINACVVTGVGIEVHQKLKVYIIIKKYGLVLRVYLSMYVTFSISKYKQDWEITSCELLG